MEIGLEIMLNQQHGDICVIAEKMEELGFESLWLPEHPIIPVHYNTQYPGSPDGSIPDAMRHQVNPFVALARASSTTRDLKLGTGICLVTEHNPLDLAKQISTLDMYSGGRFLFGIGTGWLREEAEILGVDYEHRWTQAREHVLAMKELWTKDEAEFHGKYVNFPPITCNPKPAQTPHPPILLGGGAKSVHQRVVQWGDGWLPVGADPESIENGRTCLSELAEAAGRDPSSISITVLCESSDPDLIKRYERAGADRVLVLLTAPDHTGTMSAMEDIAKKVLT